MLTIEALKEYGAGVEEGLARCMGNEAFYLRLVSVIQNEKNFDTLKESLEAGNLDTAFEAAHALKGVTGNLALTPLYKPVFEITELLRAREDTDYGPLLKEILDKKDQLMKLIQEP
ncbi:MAG: Hpt domain-containing protein [Eubacterium sp.]|nr:Hpt domain-containing protein [Eubacterium sp.]